MELTACPTSPSAFNSSTERAQLARPGLQLLKQAHVLDGNDRLVGEGRHEPDLLVGERSHLRPPDGEDADEHVLLQQGHAQNRPQAQQPLGLELSVLGVREDVGDVYDPALEGRSPRDGSAPEPNRVPPPELDVLGRATVARRPLE